MKPGQKVSITDDQGREVNGKIGDMTADALTVLDHGTRADVAYNRIVAINRPNDSLANGALIGLGTGIGLGLVAIATEDNSQCPPEGFVCYAGRAGRTSPASCCSAGWAPRSAWASTRSSTASARSTAAAVARSPRPRLSWGTAAAAS